MGLAVEQDVELCREPLFKPGEKVRSLKNIRNDGTIMGREIGETVVKKGDIGYVRDIGSFLQQFYIFAIEWVDRGTCVGMREKELESMDRPGVTGKKKSNADMDEAIEAATYRLS
jgi:nitrogen fixation protein NifZ